MRSIRFVLRVLPLLAGLALACATTSDADADLAAYVASADHLGAEQKQAMLGHRPFAGMSVGEAALAMKPVGSTLVVNERVTRARYEGEGVVYEVEFAGSPARVVDWVLAGEPGLRERKDVQPSFPASRDGTR
jgi:hypothetical protein